MSKGEPVLTNLSKRLIYNVMYLMHPLIIKSAKVLCINAKKNLNVHVPLILSSARVCMHIHTGIYILLHLLEVEKIFTVTSSLMY